MRRHLNLSLDLLCCSSLFRGFARGDAPFPNERLRPSTRADGHPQVSGHKARGRETITAVVREYSASADKSVYTTKKGLMSLSLHCSDAHLTESTVNQFT